MDYIKIRFGDDFDELASNLDRSFSDMFHAIKPQFKLTDQSWNPAVDIYQTPKEIIIRVEIAGVEKEDLSVEINSRAIRIRGRRRELPRLADSAYRLAEIQYGRFERVLYLPEPIDTDTVSSSYLNGFLEIHMSRFKQEETHRIPIQNG